MKGTPQLLAWRFLLTLLLLLFTTCSRAQQTAPASTELQNAISAQALTLESLPDSPGAVRVEQQNAEQQNVVAVAEASLKASGRQVRPCGIVSSTKVVHVDPNRFNPVHKRCAEIITPYQRFLDTDYILPLTWQQKGYLALHDLADPANFATIVGISAITIAANPHTAYGPGFEGFGAIAGISLLQDATGQFFGVFAIPALIHQDPRYFRMPDAPLRRRILYSISRTVISRSDHGAAIPNYATLLTYPITAELANLYVPGIHPNGQATVARIATGLATDPANNLLNEFLPDVAKRIHVRIIFVQTLLNNIAGGTNGVMLQ